MNASAQPLALFISYSHKDDDLRVRLDAHLSLLKRQNVFDVWHDRRIAAGREWAGAIDSALEKADVVLLLVSSDFLASDYCYDKEMTRALQRHAEGAARVIPVILRPCDWQSSQFGRLQALPRDGQPVVSHVDVDAAFTEVALALRALADDVRGGRARRPTKAEGTETAPALQPTPEGGRAADCVRAHPVVTPERESQGEPQRRPKKKLKIGAIKLAFLEFGPFELEWPPRISAIRFIALTLIGAVAVAGVIYWILLKPRIDEARDFMRWAQYKRAAGAIESEPQWSKSLPFVASVAAEARFGSKLDDGEHIRDLAPELDALRVRYPNESDVLVFEGLSSYYVDDNSEQALKQFTQAADRDPAHVEAHFLAAERHIDLAYAALGHGDESQARAAVVAARTLMERAVSRSSFARTLPRYANSMADLYQLEGDAAGAYDQYASLAPLHSLSALQAAFVSWRLPEASTKLKYSLENAEVAIARIEKESEQKSELEGWSFRIDATQLVDVRSKLDKQCLFTWAVEISKSLHQISDRTMSIANTAPPGLATVPKSCREGALAARIGEIVCVQVLTAQRAIAQSDSRRKVLDKWRGAPLQCGQDLQPLPVLSIDTADSNRTALRRRRSGDVRELDLS